MNKQFIFRPPTQLGLIVHITIILILLGVGAFGLWQAAQAEIGPIFLLYLLASLLVLIFLPAMVYRAYALYGAAYVVERDGIYLRWGLRSVVIPMDQVEWVHPRSELEKAPPLPWIRIPGSILGSRAWPGEGKVEYLASTTSGLILLAAGDRFYALSPEDPQAFLQAFHRYMELGSLSPVPSRSVYPSLLLSRFWAVKSARYLVLSGLVLSLILLVWVILTIPQREVVYLGFDPQGNPRDAIPAVRLLLLPSLNALLFLMDFLAGLFYFRRAESRAGEGLESPSMAYAQAYLLWSGGALMPLLFLISTFFILRVV